MERRVTNARTSVDKATTQKMIEGTATEMSQKLINLLMEADVNVHHVVQSTIKEDPGNDIRKIGEQFLREKKDEIDEIRSEVDRIHQTKRQISQAARDQLEAVLRGERKENRKRKNPKNGNGTSVTAHESNGVHVDKAPAKNPAPNIVVEDIVVDPGPPRSFEPSEFDETPDDDDLIVLETSAASAPEPPTKVVRDTPPVDEPEVAEAFPPSKSIDLDAVFGSAPSDASHERNGEPLSNGTPAKSEFPERLDQNEAFTYMKTRFDRAWSNVKTGLKDPSSDFADDQVAREMEACFGKGFFDPGEFGSLVEGCVEYRSKANRKQPTNAAYAKMFGALNQVTQRRWRVICFSIEESRAAEKVPQSDVADSGNGTGDENADSPKSVPLDAGPSRADSSGALNGKPAERNGKPVPPAAPDADSAPAAPPSSTPLRPRDGNSDTIPVDPEFSLDADGSSDAPKSKDKKDEASTDSKPIEDPEEAKKREIELLVKDLEKALDELFNGQKSWMQINEAWSKVAKKIPDGPEKEALQSKLDKLYLDWTQWPTLRTKAMDEAEKEKMKDFLTQTRTHALPKKKEKGHEEHGHGHAHGHEDHLLGIWEVPRPLDDDEFHADKRITGSSKKFWRKFLPKKGKRKSENADHHGDGHDEKKKAA